MELTLKRDHFNNGLQYVTNTLSTRTTMPVLTTVLLTAEDGILKLSTTNLDQSLSCSLIADVKEPGSICLSAKKLASIIKVLPEDTITLATKSSSRCRLTSGKDIFNLASLDKSEFPPATPRPDTLPLLLPQGKLLRALKAVSYAMSEDETTYVLNGTRFDLADKDNTLIAATDGRRLSVYRLGSISEQLPSCTVPHKTIVKLEKLLRSDGDVRIGTTDRHIFFEITPTDEIKKQNGLVGSIYFTSKLIDGNFPNYQLVIPPKLESSLKIDREALALAVRRASLVNSLKQTITITTLPNKLQITGESPEIGISQVEVPVEYSGEKINLALNPQFLSEVLKSTDTETLSLEIVDALKPCVLRDGDTFLGVIMPLRIN